MGVEKEISAYLESLEGQRGQDMRQLHEGIVAGHPRRRLWFSDGLDESGKIVTNPSIGYGAFSRTYADGKTVEQFRAGISANSSGITVYLMGIEDRNFLRATYGDSLGKAETTSYCFKFKKLADVNSEVLMRALAEILDSDGPAS